MYIARFSYSVLPINRQRALDFIHREVAAAKRKNLNARLLVPLTRGHGGAGLQFEVELANLDQFERFRERGIESDDETSKWMHAFSAILLCPPEVELLRVERGRTGTTASSLAADLIPGRRAKQLKSDRVRKRARKRPGGRT